MRSNWSDFMLIWKLSDVYWKLIVISMVCLVVSACSNDETRPAGGIPEAQLKALEKAGAVEDKLKKQHEELRKELDEG